MRRAWAVFWAAFALLFCAGQALALELELPVACIPGEDCWVQQYPDHEPGPAATDYTCGGQSYDGHDGTDVRLRDTRASAEVRAAAAGVVMALRDGMMDKLARNAEDRVALAGRECGNGLVIAHDGGYETQYCHMKQASLAVAKGETVAAGQRLGLVGYSGDASFPHLHLSLRRNGVKLDPFSGDLDAPCEATDTGLWSAAAAQALSYQPGSLLRLGFAQGKVEMAALEEGRLAGEPPSEEWPALVAYGWLINLQKGDRLRVTLEQPAATPTTNEIVLDRNKAQYLLFSGVKRPVGGWPSGSYRASISLRRNGSEVLAKSLEATLP